MIKKIIVVGTTLFLLFEVLYFNSNITANKMYSREDGRQVYKLAIQNQKEDFLKQYQNIILEDGESSTFVLTNSKVIEEISEKYNITIEK